jgi:putative membrane protein
MRIGVTLLYLVLILVAVSFAALNASSVAVNLYFSTVTMPISVMMTLMLGIGIIIGFFIFILRYWRLKSDNRKLKNQLKLTEQEIKNLRTIPVNDHYTGFGDL